jgi:hypothetical protein
MNLARTIMALMIALSVALLPAAAGAGVDLKSADKSADMTDMSAMGHDCCPPKADPCDKAMGDCSSMAACALKCFSFSAALFSTVVFRSILPSVAPQFESHLFRLQIGSPPFRPPRA